MRRVGKIIGLALVTLTIVSSISTTALAADRTQVVNNIEASQVVIRAEQKEWSYRLYKGEKQKRLWSITYQKWLTEWIPV